MLSNLYINPIQDGPFRGGSRIGGGGGGQKDPLPKICYKNLAIAKFVTVIPYLTNIQSI